MSESAPSTDSSQKPVSPAAVGAGRGLLFITFAKLWFMVMGYVVQFALPRALGSPAKWGVWVLVLSAVSPVNNVMITATIQGVSKFVSEADGHGAVLRAGLRLQAFVAGGSALAFFLLAPVIAGFWHDPSLVGELRIASGVILLYGFYAVFVGAANGARAFHKQAALDVSSSTMRTVLVVGAAMWLHEAKASLGGWVAAAALILLASTAVVGFGERSADSFPWQRLGKFMSGLVGFLLILNLLMFVDGLLLKRLVTEAAIRAGEADPATVANTAEGLYGAVQAVARLPYQLILAVTFVIFPLVSRATFDADREKARGYVRVTMRYSLVVVALLGAVLSVRPDASMRLLYKPEYAVGAPALAVLAIGYVCFSMFSIACTVLNSAGRVMPSLVLGAGTLGLAIAANWLVVPRVLDAHGDALLAAAAATTLAMGVGMLASGVWLYRQFGAFLSLFSVVRVALCVAAAWAVGHFWPAGSGFLAGKVGTLLSMTAAGGAFLAVALASRELDVAELLRARRAR